VVFFWKFVFPQFQAMSDFDYINLKPQEWDFPFYRDRLEKDDNKAIERDREVAQRKDYQATAAEKSEKLEIAREEIVQLKEQVCLSNQKIKEMSAQVRDIPLISIAESVGLHEMEPGIFPSERGNVRIHEKGFVNDTDGTKGRNAIDFARHLTKMPLWVNRELSQTVFGGKQNPEYWQTIFESGKTPQNQQVLPSGINLMKMIQG
jgi:hypothetical protein